MLSSVTAVVLGPASAAYAAALPDCRYDDILTARHEYSQWDQSLLDPIFMLQRRYSPSDLVGVSAANLSGGGSVRRIVIDDLRAMVRAAADAGKPIAAASAYRSYSRQASIFNSYVRQQGFQAAALVSARPGHSEHQLGTTIDFKSKGGKAPWNYADWAKTGAGKWMKEHAWEFGWIMSYPKGKSPGTTCYKYEPWHYRYFGRDVARQIHQSGLTTREWLWRQGYGEDPGDPDPPGDAPSIPADLAAEPLGGGQIRLTWSASDGGEGAISYRIFRNGRKVGTTSELTFLDQPKRIGEHEYQVRAVDEDGRKSDKSEKVLVTSF